MGSILRNHPCGDAADLLVTEADICRGSDNISLVLLQVAGLAEDLREHLLAAAFHAEHLPHPSFCLAVLLPRNTCRALYIGGSRGEICTAVATAYDSPPRVGLIRSPDTLWKIPGKVDKGLMIV